MIATLRLTSQTALFPLMSDTNKSYYLSSILRVRTDKRTCSLVLCLWVIGLFNFQRLLNSRRFIKILRCNFNNNNNNNAFTAIGLLPGGSGYFTCIQNMKLVTAEFKPGGLYEKHVVATWNLGNHLSICY